MKYDLFQRLVKRKEKATVDFKIQCGAFDSGSQRRMEENAELLKDICAMSNNGNAASYILIGVGDNGRDFKSVANAQLNSDNVQRLVQEYLRPVPRVRVHVCLWRRGSLKHRHKRFIIIQVGPNPRAAFHFARDIIDWQKKICFRRNEVWVRNDATSDVATPDQVLRLLGKDTPGDRAELDQNTEYFKAPKEQQGGLVLKDTRAFFDEIGAPICKALSAVLGPHGGKVWDNDMMVALRIRGKDFAFRCALRRWFLERGAHDLAVSECWQLEHGILFLPLRDPVKSSFSFTSVHHKQSWGWFTIYSRSNLWSRHQKLPPRQEEELSIPVITLRSPKDTVQLRTAFTGLIEFLEEDDVAFNQLDTARKAVNRCLQQWSDPGEIRRVIPGEVKAREAARLARQVRAIRGFVGRARR